MAVSKKVTPTKATVKAQASVSAELEAKLASLQKLVESLQKDLAAQRAKSEEEHKALSAKCDACCSATSGSDPALEAKMEKIWRWLSQDRLFRRF